eukprot:6469894-Amphidinium_carterae.1
MTYNTYVTNYVCVCLTTNVNCARIHLWRKWSSLLGRIAGFSETTVVDGGENEVEIETFKVMIAELDGKLAEPPVKRIKLCQVLDHCREDEIPPLQPAEVVTAYT